MVAHMECYYLSTVVSLSPFKKICDCWLCFRQPAIIQPIPTPPLAGASILEPIKCPRAFLEDVKFIQDIHDTATLRSVVSSMCRTAPKDDIGGLLPSNFRNPRPITCGGMSRIYSATDSVRDEEVIIKITDRSRSLGGFESHGYGLLRTAGLPMPRILWSGQRGMYDILILEKLVCTLTAALTGIAHKHHVFGGMLKPIIHHVDALLRGLKDNGIVFCDLSADNIMCRFSPDSTSMELILIDPQFALPFATLSSKVGHEWAEHFDRVHFGLKLRALSLVPQRNSLHSIADKMCKELLGFVPSDSDVKVWLTKKLPSTLRIAYGLLGKIL